MSRAFERIQFETIPATTNLPDPSGWALDLLQNEDGAIETMLRHSGMPMSSFFFRDSFKIDAEDENLRVAIDRAWIANYNFSVGKNRPLANAITARSYEVTVDWKGVDQSDRVSVTFFLTGIRFLSESGTAENVSLGGFDFAFSLVDDYVALGKKTDVNWGTVTAAAEVVNVTSGQIGELKAIIEDANWLLSFGFGGEVHCVRIEIFNASSVRTSARLQYPGSVPQPFFAPLLLDQQKGLLKEYLELGFEPFRSAKKTHKLNRVIHLLLMVAAESNINVQALMLANVLEIVRYNFALNVMVPRGDAVTDGDQFNRTKPVPGKGKRLTFREILEAFSVDLKLTSWSANESRIVEFRNKTIHEGEVLGTSSKDQIQNILDVLHFCHCFTLALLDWDRGDGKYIPANSDPMIIRETKTEKSSSTSVGVNLTKFVR